VATGAAGGLTITLQCGADFITTKVSLTAGGGSFWWIGGSPGEATDFLMRNRMVRTEVERTASLKWKPFHLEIDMNGPVFTVIGIFPSGPD